MTDIKSEKNVNKKCYVDYFILREGTGSTRENMMMQEGYLNACTWLNWILNKTIDEIFIADLIADQEEKWTR